MDSDISALQRRITELEEELDNARAEVTTASITAEHHSKHMEESQAALAKQHEQVLEDVSRLQTDNTRLTEELSSLKAAHLSLQSTSLEKDTNLEQRASEVDQLHASKRSLDRLLEHKQGEMDDVHNRLKSAMEKIVLLTAENRDLDAEAHQAQARVSSYDLTKLTWEHEKQLLERHVQQLESELADKGTTLQSVRSQTSSEIMDLEQKLAEASRHNARLKAAEGDLQTQLNRETKACEAAQRQLKEARDAAVEREQHHDKELATAQRVAGLYKTSKEERTTRAAELEGIVRELKDHLQEADAAHKEALALVEQQAAETAKALDEERSQRQRMIEAAAAGQISLEALGMPREQLGQVLPEGMTITTLFSKYTEAVEGCRSEQLKNRRNELILEQLVGEVEKKAVLFLEQQQEHVRVQSAYNSMGQAVEAASQEKRAAQAQLRSWEQQARRDAKQQKVLEQQVADLSRQVTTLLGQVHRLQGGTIGNGADREQALVPTGANGQATVHDVMTQKLLTFTDIEEMQKRNTELGLVNRELADQLESTEAEIKARLQADFDEKLAVIEQQHDQLVAQQDNERKLVQQLVRQRDMYKNLAAGQENAPRNGQLAITDGSSPGVANGHAQAGPDYQQLLNDAKAEQERERKEAAEHHSMLQGEMAKVKLDAQQARAEGHLGKNQAAWEKERSDRLESQLAEQDRNYRALNQQLNHNQETMSKLHSQLAAAAAAKESANEARSAAELKHSKEAANCAVLEGNLERAHKDLSDATQDRIKAASQLQAAKALSASAEADFVRDRAHLNEENARLQHELSDNLRALSEEKRRAREAAITVDSSQSAANARVQKAEADAAKAQEQLAQAQQAASNAEVKATSLQKALQKAEEQRSSLQMALDSRHPHSDNPESSRSPAGDGPSRDPSTRSAADRISELEFEIKLLRTDLAHAQEAQAKAQSWHLQFKAMAQASDEACAAFQEKHEKYKAEADARAQALSQDAQQLRDKVISSESELSSLQQNERSIRDQTETEKQHLRDEISSLNVVAEGLRRDSQAAGTRMQRLTQDIAQLRREKQDTQQRYEQQVVDHGDTAKRLSALDATYTAAAQEVTRLQGMLQAVQAAQAAGEQTAKEEAQRQAQALQTAQRRTQELEQHNEALLKQLEAAVEQGRAESGAAIAAAGAGSIYQQRPAAH